MIKILIEPEKLTPELARIFFDYVQRQMAVNQFIFKGMVEHQISGISSVVSPAGTGISSTELPGVYSLIFPETILCQVKQGPYPEHAPSSYALYHLNLIGSKLGTGNFAAVYAVKSEFEFDGHTLRSSEPETPHAIKIHKYCYCESDVKGSSCGKKKHVPLFRINAEYLQAAKAPHLGAQFPFVDSNNFSFSLMNRMPGISLEQILQADRAGSRLLTISERMHLTKILLITLKQQVTDFNLVHGDIKPENIIVSMAPLAANVIDYQFASALDRGFLKIVCSDYSGSPNFLAYEFYSAYFAGRSYIKTPKMDVYALGRTLSQLWTRTDRGFSHDSIEALYSYMRYELQFLNDLFVDISDEQLTPQLKKQLKGLLRGMLAPDRAGRMDIQEAIDYFENVFQHFQRPVANTAPIPSSSLDVVAFGATPSQMVEKGAEDVVNPSQAILPSVPRSSTIKILSTLPPAQMVEKAGITPPTPVLVPGSGEFAFKGFVASPPVSDRVQSHPSANEPLAAKPSPKYRISSV